jgi:hypothetical protein
LTDKEIKAFHEDGYLIIRDVFDPADLEPLRQEVHACIQKKAEALVVDGALTDAHADEPFERQLACIHHDSEEAGKAILEVIQGRAGGVYTGTESMSYSNRTSAGACR